MFNFGMGAFSPLKVHHVILAILLFPHTLDSGFTKIIRLAMYAMKIFNQSINNKSVHVLLWYTMYIKQYCLLLWSTVVSGGNYQSLSAVHTSFYHPLVGWP